MQKKMRTSLPSCIPLIHLRSNKLVTAFLPGSGKKISSKSSYKKLIPFCIKPPKIPMKRDMTGFHVWDDLKREGLLKKGGEDENEGIRKQQCSFFAQSISTMQARNAHGGFSEKIPDHSKMAKMYQK